MRKYISKITFILMMILVIGIGYGVSVKAADDKGVVGTTNLNNTTENSAKVGDQLKEPEKGWKRYDDTNSNINYLGSWQTCIHPQVYGGELKYINSTPSTALVKFNFSGTKIRYIGRKWIGSIDSSYDQLVEVKIDGKVVGSFSHLSADKVYMSLEFEKTGLSNKEHYVEIYLSPEKLGIKQVVLDAIDIDENGELLPYSNTTLKATADNKNQSITLNWDKVDEATGYNVKRSTTQGTGYETIASDVKENTYVDEDIQAGITYYYIVTPIINDKECTPYKEASATIEKSAEPTKPEPKGDAVLFITMTNGNIKSYNVSMKTVNKFIEWYEDRASGSNGMPFYKFDKTRNEDEIKTEYIVFDKISSFQVEQNK